MATAYRFLQTSHDFFAELQERADLAEERRHKRFLAVLLLQRMLRGYQLRKHVAWLSHNATIIQCAFRMHLARKVYRAALRRAVRSKHDRHYYIAARKLQALYRGHTSRRTKFCYRRYRRWLLTIKERGDRRAAEAAEFGIRSRADDLRILEEEARQWLAFVVFKLHHLMRTFARAGVYSDPNSNELSEFEKLLKSIHYTEYMKRLKRKYNEFVRKNRPAFSNKRLFPVIGDGADYWYLSLPEMYELTCPDSNVDERERARHSDTYYRSPHTKPFLWRKVRAPEEPGRGPFTPPRSEMSVTPEQLCPPPTPTTRAATSEGHGDQITKGDPRFYLYVKYYKPNDPLLFKYVDFHINALLKRKYSVEKIESDNKLDKVTGC